MRKGKTESNVHRERGETVNEEVRSLWEKKKSIPVSVYSVGRSQKSMSSDKLMPGH